MKKTFLIILLLISAFIFADLNDYTTTEINYKAATIGEYDTTNLEANAIQTVVTLDTLDYADTSEHAFTLNSGNDAFEVELYSDYVVTVKITYRGNPNNVNLTVGTASAGHDLTAANAISQLDSDFWSTEVIDLDTSGGTSTDYYLVPDCLFNGKYIYFKYQYSGDPGTAPKVAIHINRI